MNMPWLLVLIISTHAQDRSCTNELCHDKMWQGSANPSFGMTPTTEYNLWKQYTLRSVMMSGQYKYRRNPSACKIAEESACTTGDSACNRHEDSSAKKHGQWSSKNRKRDSSCTYTGHSPSHYWECRVIWHVLNFMLIVHGPCHPYQFLKICIPLCNDPIGLIQKGHLKVCFLVTQTLTSEGRMGSQWVSKWTWATPRKCRFKEIWLWYI